MHTVFSRFNAQPRLDAYPFKRRVDKAEFAINAVGVNSGSRRLFGMAAFIRTHTRKCYVSLLTFKVMKKFVTVIVYVLGYVLFHLSTISVNICCKTL